MSRRIGLMLLMLLGACSTTEVPDTDCASPELASDRIRFASMVLVGTAQEFDGTTAQFEIEEIWRGPDLPREIEVIPEPGRAYTAGVRYLLFPTDSPSPLSDARCSATTRWSDELGELRPVAARTPGGTPASDADLPWEWVIGATVVIGVAVGGRRIIERRRHPEPEWDPEFSFEEGS